VRAELEKVLEAERKNKRQLAELRALRQKVSHQVDSKDKTKMLAMIDEEIAAFLK